MAHCCAWHRSIIVVIGATFNHGKKRKSVRNSCAILGAVLSCSLLILFSHSLLTAGPARPQRSKTIASSILLVRESLSTCSEKRVSRAKAYRTGQDVESEVD